MVKDRVPKASGITTAPYFCLGAALNLLFWVGIHNPGAIIAHVAIAFTPPPRFFSLPAKTDVPPVFSCQLARRSPSEGHVLIFPANLQTRETLRLA